MFGLRKQINKELKKISQSFKDIKKDMITKDKIDLMIREAFDRERLKVREVSPRTPQTKMRKKVNTLLNKAEIMQEIRVMEQKGISTEDIYNNIVNIKQLCKKTCFYKYLKIIRKQSAELREPEQRTQ